jgi:hypothetical protein
MDMENPKMDDFKANFKLAFKEYLSHNWENARILLENGLALKPDDGPSIRILDYIKTFGYKPPADWEGYRDLAE